MSPRPQTSVEFASLAEARVFVAAAGSAIATLAAADLGDFFWRLEIAYEEFPELEEETPRRALLDRLRTAGESLADAEALPILLFCAACDPAGAAVPALLCRAAGSGGPAALTPVLDLLHPYRTFGWDEMRPVVEALRAEAAADGALKALSQVLDRLTLDHGREAAEFGNWLTPLIATTLEEPDLEPRSLGEAAVAARRRLAQPTAASAAREGERQALLSLSGRLAELLPGQPSAITPPAQPRPPAAWPSGRFAFIEFAAQWPGFEIVVPASLMRTAYATLSGEGALTARQHPPSSPFCFGPFLNLPGGRYNVRIAGRTGEDVDFLVSVTRYIGAKQACVCERRLASAAALSGAIADFTFDSDQAMHNMEVVVRVDRPSADFSITEVRIALQRPD